MRRARLLRFPDAPAATPRDREPVSPFRHLMPPRQLTPRELLHRRRMVIAHDERIAPFMRSESK